MKDFNDFRILMHEFLINYKDRYVKSDSDKQLSLLETIETIAELQTKVLIDTLENYHEWLINDYLPEHGLNLRK